MSAFFSTWVIKTEDRQEFWVFCISLLFLLVLCVTLNMHIIKILNYKNLNLKMLFCNRNGHIQQQISY